MILLLGRHGQSEANIQCVFSNGLNKHGLTETGRSQAQQMAERMEHKNIQKIYTSPILRAVQTAEIVSKQLGIQFQVEPALAEFSVGDWEGMNYEVLWEAHEKLFEKWLLEKDCKASNGGGENYLDIQKRYLPFIYSLVSLPDQYGNVLLIGHGGTTLAMLPCLTSDLTPAEVLHLEYKNTAVIRLERRETTFRFLGME